MNKTTKLPPPEQVVLEKIRMYARHCMGEELLQSLDLNTYINVIEGLVNELTCEVYSENIDQQKRTITLYPPATWWDMFKDQYFKGWLLSKFPIKRTKIERTVTFKKVATYPRLPMVFKNPGPIVFKYFSHIT